VAGEKGLTDGGGPRERKAVTTVEEWEGPKKKAIIQGRGREKKNGHPWEQDSFVQGKTPQEQKEKGSSPSRKSIGRGEILKHGQRGGTAHHSRSLRKRST